MPSSTKQPCHLKWSNLTKVIELTDPNVGLIKTTFGTSSRAAQQQQQLQSSPKPTEKIILNQISGQAHPGQVVALMGPSGSGKTSLLDVLSGRSSTQYGSLTLNGTEISIHSTPSTLKALKRKVAYIQQEDIFFTHLTVRDQLTYTAFLRLGESSTTPLQTHATVEAIVKTLRLTKCANTPIRLLSGGERKRVNIGTELLTDPSIVLLDEPTSGLDSTSAVHLMRLVRDLAQREGLTIITSIHQPSSAVFLNFDRVLLLADGCGVYYGSPKQSLKYVKGLGMECPDGYNAADHWMDLLVEQEVEEEEEDETELPLGGNGAHPHHDGGGSMMMDCLDTTSHPVHLLGPPPTKTPAAPNKQQPSFPISVPDSSTAQPNEEESASPPSLDQTSFPVTLAGKVPRSKEHSLDRTSFPVHLGHASDEQKNSLDRTTLPVSLMGDDHVNGLDRTSLPVTLDRDQKKGDETKEKISQEDEDVEEGTATAPYPESNGHHVTMVEEEEDAAIQLPKMKKSFARFKLINRPSNYTSVSQKEAHLLDKTKMYRDQYKTMETSKAKLITHWDVDAFAQQMDETECDVSDSLSCSSMGNSETNNNHNNHKNISSLVSTTTGASALVVGQRFKTSWMRQFRVLLHRSMKNSRSALLTPLNFIKAFMLGFFTGALWFQLPNDEMHVRERGSFLFFSITYWVFDATFSAVFGFPQERDILFKERASGSYHLSAYFLSKIMSDLPTRLVLPITFWTISYWMAGLNPSFWVFLGTLGYMLLSVLAGESYGLLVSAYVLDFEKSMTFMIVFSLTCMAAGGFYVQNIPSWIAWAKYLSPFKFGYESAQILVFNRPVECDGSGDLALYCTDGVGYADSDEVLEILGSEGGHGVNIGILLCIIIIPRYFAYLALRSKRGAERS